MNPPGWNETEKHRLLCAWLAAELAAEDAARLLQAAEGDDHLRREMAALQGIERLLRHHGVAAGNGQVFASEVLARLRQPSVADRGFLARVIQRIQPSATTEHRRTWRQHPVLWSVASLLLLAVVLAFGWHGYRHTAVATLTGMEAVHWAADQRPLQSGQQLPRGVVAIEGGFLRLRFASGALAILEGPARLELLSRNRALLQCGKILADVPDSAKGFTVESPGGRLVDLGTRFGVQVEDHGETEVHVLQGVVRATVRGERNARELRQSQGLRMTPGRVQPLEVDQSRFLTALPPHSAGPLTYVHWSFDEGQGGLAADSGRALGGPESTGHLTSLSGTGPVPTWVAGRFGTALEFDGRDGFVSTGFRGIGGAEPRTVAFWVRVPQDWTPVNAYALVSWGSFYIPGAAWQISVNPEAKDGPVGRIRVGIREASVIGTRDVRDGEWHHVAAVLYDGEQPRDTTHILLYIDGQLEPAFRKSIHEVRTGVEQPDALPVRLGRNLNATHARQAVFRGTLDEVFIVNAALSQEAIARLMRENQPPKNQSPSGHSQVGRPNGAEPPMGSGAGSKNTKTSR